MLYFITGILLTVSEPAPSTAAEDAFKSFTHTMEVEADAAAEIAAMFAREQAARFAIIELMQREELSEADRTWLGAEAGARIDAIDARNVARLREIVENLGWERIDAMQRGRIMRFAWSLVSHADHDPDFQEQALTELDGLLTQGRVIHIDRGDFARVSDAVALDRGGRQRYGTQLECAEGTWTPFRLEAPEGVDERRRSVGLEPMNEYVATHRELYGDCPA